MDKILMPIIAQSSVDASLVSTDKVPLCGPGIPDALPPPPPPHPASSVAIAAESISPDDFEFMMKTPGFVFDVSHNGRHNAALTTRRQHLDAVQRRLAQ